MNTETTSGSEQAAASASGKPGPKTPEGKAISSLNAVKHSFCSRTLVVATSQLEAFRKFSDELKPAYRAIGPREEHALEQILVYKWRIGTLQSAEINMLALEGAERTQQVSTGDPDMDEVVGTSHAVFGNAKQLDTLTRYEGRLKRWLKNAETELQTLQAERHKREWHDIQEAAKMDRLLKTKGEKLDLVKMGFVCSWEQIEIYNYRKEVDQKVADAHYDDMENRRRTRKM